MSLAIKAGQTGYPDGMLADYIEVLCRYSLINLYAIKPQIAWLVNIFMGIVDFFR